jgi:hypothetical protein
MQDTRWGNAQQTPLSNGPVRMVTPPGPPTFRLVEDEQLIEFLLPFPMHIANDGAWAELESKVGGTELFIHKPISICQPYEPTGRMGNEAPDVFCSIVRVRCKHDPKVSYPKASEVWPLVETLLAWIRVKARHYWMLHGGVGFGAIYRGSVMTQEGQTIAQRNVATYGRNLIVRPLDEPLWLSIRDELTGGAKIPVSESVFCDALVSAVAGDENKALLELGVAAEIEITELLTVVSQTSPSTANKSDFITEQGSWDTFSKKLKEWPQRLGLQEAAAFSPPGIFPDWCTVVKELYRFRGSVAHSGKLRAGTTAQNVSAYIFSTHALFAYCRAQRALAGIQDYTYPAASRQYDQIVALREGEMFGETAPIAAKIP